MASSYTQLQKDLVRGKEGEDSVQKFLKEKFNIVTENLGGENPYWDLDGRHMYTTLLNNGKDVSNYKKYGITYEVKKDDTSKKTGNFYVEVWSNKRCLNSGCIFNCKADTIVVVSGKKLYFINRALFLSWIVENMFCESEEYKTWKTKTKRVGGKDGFAAAKNNPDVQGLLIPLEHIEKSYCCMEVFDFK